MIRTNLSTRPFYNVRAVNVWIGIVAVVALVATAFNVTSVARYSGSNTELMTRASQDEAAAADMRATAARLRAGVDPRQIEAASADAREANELIDRRTLSWTELFNRFEKTLPPDVRITAVRPRIDRSRQIILEVTVRARSVVDIDAFMTALDGLGAFQDVRSSRERTTEEGEIESALVMVYLPQATPPTPPNEPAASAVTTDTGR